MQQNFNDILSSMLADLDKGKSVEEIIASKMKEMNLSEESQAKVNEAVGYVDKIEAEHASLKQALDNKCSRQEWLDYKIQKAKDALPEELKDKADEVLEKVIENNMEGL